MSDEPCLRSMYRGCGGAVTSLDVNSTNEKLAAGSEDGSIFLQVLSDEKKAYRFADKCGVVHDVAFSPSGKFLASASHDHMVRIWRPDVKGESTIFRAHNGVVSSVCMSPDGTRLLTASHDKTVKVWTFSKHRFLFSLSDHTHWVRSACYSRDSKLIASASDDKTVRVYDANNQKQIAHFQEKSAVNHVTFHPGNSNIAVGLQDGHTKIYDIKMRECVQCYTSKPQLSAVNSVDFHPTGKFLLSADNDGVVKVIDVMESTTIFSVKGHQGAVNAVKFFDDGHKFATGGADKIIMVWDSNFDTELSQGKERSDEPALVDASFMINERNNVVDDDDYVITTNMMNNMQVHNGADNYLNVAEENTALQGTQQITAQQQQITTQQQQITAQQQEIETLTHTTQSQQQEIDTLSHSTQSIQEGMEKLSDTLNYQMSALTQTLTLLERRFCIVEDKVKDILQAQQ